jgi:diacylglycerol kinase (ATP)
MTLPTLVLYNPASGRKRGAAFADRLCAALQRRGRDTVRLATSAEENVLAAIDPASYASIVVVGGDGSLHAAVNGLARFPVPLAFGGVGTVNVLSRELGLPTDPEGLAEVVLNGRVVHVPLLRAGGRRFVLFAEVGFLGRAVTRVNRWRAETGKHGELEFVTLTARTVCAAFGRRLTVELPGRNGDPPRRYSNVLVTRVRTYGGALRMPAEPDGRVGLAAPSFHLIGYRSRTPLGHLAVLALAALRLLPRLARGPRLGLFDALPAERAMILGPPGTGIHLDAESDFPGSAPLALPLSIEADGASVPLLVPAER